MNVVLRAFTPMSAALEFRGFVYGGQLNALSQYCSGQYFPELVSESNRTHILTAIRDCFARVAPRITQANYIVDFVVARKELKPATSKSSADPSTSGGIAETDPIADAVHRPQPQPSFGDASASPYSHALVIELNPFFADTGACLFNWKSAADRKAIQSGPFEFRVRTTPQDDPYAHIPSLWADAFRQARGLTVVNPRKLSAEQPADSLVPARVRTASVLVVVILIVAWLVQRLLAAR